MKTMSMRLLALCSITALGACAGETLPGSAGGPEVEINIAPLTLPNVLGVEYALAVFNASPTASGIFDDTGAVVGNTGDLVWQQNSITSNQYGNGPGGDVSYVGPCDADVVSGKNWVALALKQVNVGNSYGSEDGLAPFVGTLNVLDDQNTAFSGTLPNDLDPDFVNPSPYNEPYVLSFDCNENQDTSVVFNLTVMRDANQGFFDIAVNFEDIFCSMKIDTCYDASTPIELLLNDDGSRAKTAVLATACSAGTDDANTEMWMAPLTVTCTSSAVDDTVFRLDPTGWDGSSYVPGNQIAKPGEADGRKLRYQLYWGQEDLGCDDGTGTDVPCNKEYWNVAINLDDLKEHGLKDCTVATAVTASSSSDTSPPPFKNGRLSGTGQSYGFVRFNADLTDASAEAECFQGPMGSDYAKAMYGTTLDLAMSINSPDQVFPQFCYSYTQGSDTTPVHLKDVSGYFANQHTSAQTARYVGTVKATSDDDGTNVQFKDVRFAFGNVGQSVAPACGATVKKIDAAAARVDWAAKNGTGGTNERQILSWKGFVAPTVGTYTLTSYGKPTGGDWAQLGNAATLDFSNAETRNDFLKDHPMPDASKLFTEFAAVLTRDDDIDDPGLILINFGFAGSTDPVPGSVSIFALCSNETQECDCYDSGGDTACPNPLGGDLDTYWY